MISDRRLGESATSAVRDRRYKARRRPSYSFASHCKCAADGLDSRFRGNDQCFEKDRIPNDTTARPPRLTIREGRLILEHDELCTRKLPDFQGYANRLARAFVFEVVCASENQFPRTQGVILTQRSCEEQQHETAGDGIVSIFFPPGSREGPIRGIQLKQGETEGSVIPLWVEQFDTGASWFENPFPTFPLKGNCREGREETDQPGWTSGDPADEPPAGDASQIATERSRREDGAEYPVQSQTICRRYRHIDLQLRRRLGRFIKGHHTFYREAETAGAAPIARCEFVLPLWTRCKEQGAGSR